MPPLRTRNPHRAHRIRMTARYRIRLKHRILCRALEKMRDNITQRDIGEQHEHVPPLCGHGETPAPARDTTAWRVGHPHAAHQHVVMKALRGALEDRLSRRMGTGTSAVHLPHVSPELDYVRTSGNIVGNIHDSRTGVASRRKTVEPMAQFRGALEFTVEAGLFDSPLEIPSGTHSLSAVRQGELAFSVREMPVDPATGQKSQPTTYHSPLPRITRSLGLSAGDIVAIRVAQTGGVAGTGTWTSLDGSVTVTLTHDGNGLVYVSKLKSGLPACRYVFEAQYNHAQGARKAYYHAYDGTAISSDTGAEQDVRGCQGCGR
jgi:hypothetical protein